MHYLRSRNVATGVMRDQGGASISDTHRPEPAWVPRLDGTAGGTVWHSNLELWSHHVWSLQGYQRRWAPYSLGCSHAHGSANTLYKTFVCFKMGSVCERVRLISTWLLAPYRMFWVSRCTDWIVTIDTEVYVAAIAVFVPRRAGSHSVKKTTSPMSTFVSALGPGSGLRAFSQQPFGPLTSVG